MKYKLKTRALALGMLIMPHLANAADYQISNANVGYDADYPYLYNDSTSMAYACGTMSSDHLDGNYSSIFYMTNGQTLYDSKNSRLLYCCEDLGYFINYGNTSTLPTPDTCTTQYNWVSLGSNKFCRAAKKSVYNRCAFNRGSGILNPSDIGGCEYSNGTCSTFTHCAHGYYKNGTVCTECPDGGTTSGYTSEGITACYLPIGATGSDTTGAFKIVNDNCSY